MTDTHCHGGVVYKDWGMVVGDHLSSRPEFLLGELNYSQLNYVYLMMCV